MVKVKDMTAGSVAPILIKFSIPLLISVVFQQLYSISDSIIAGQFIDKSALAAIGASYPITMIFLAFGTGMSSGCSVVISTFFGAKDIKNMKTAVSTTVISTVILAAALTAAGFFASGLMLRALGTDEAVMADASSYLNIFTLGLVFLFLYNICTGIFSALGDSSTPLYFLIGSSVGNILLDLLFVAVLKMGVPGTAWATFIAQGICSVLAFIVLYRRLKSIKCEKPDLFRFRMLSKIASLSIPGILQQSFVSVGNLFVQSLVNSCGLDVMAGYSSAIKLNVFAVTCFSAVCNSVSSFTAQNVGARKYLRVKKGFAVGALMSAGMAALFSLVYLPFAGQLIYIFMDKNNVVNAGAAQAGADFLHIVAPFYITVALKITADGVLRGAGLVKQFMFATFADLILRVGFAFVLCPQFGARGIWMSWPVGWTTAMIMSLLFYFFYARKITRKMSETAAVDTNE